MFLKNREFKPKMLNKLSFDDHFKYCKHNLKFLRIKLAKKIVIGSANIGLYGWVKTDKESLNVIIKDDFLRYWKPNSRIAFLAEHVWEHLTEEEANQANMNCFEFLRPGGRLRIAVPDGFHINPDYIAQVRPGGIGSGADDHKILYNYQLIAETLEKVGFKIELLEYWDENGEFHFRDWHPKDGKINRSKRYDLRNQDGSLTYTSLIVDAIKP